MPMTGPYRVADIVKIAEFGNGDLIIGSTRDIIFICELEEALRQYRVGDEVSRKDENPFTHVVMKFNSLASLEVMQGHVTRARGYLLNRHWFENE